MSSTFPTTLDTMTNPAVGSKLSTIPHSTLETNQNDAIAALEAKVGVTGSGVSTSLDYKLTNPSSISPGHKHTPSDSMSATGTPSSTTFLRGDNTWSVPAGPNIQVFTSSGTWTKPAGALSVQVTLIGGGGGGCGASAGSTGGGGGGGQLVQATFDASVLTSTVAFVVGAAGAGGSSASGGFGGDTVFGAYLTATGGGGGLTGTSGGGYSGFLGTAQDLTQAALQSMFGTGGIGNAAAKAGSDGSAYWAGGGGNKYSNNGVVSVGGLQRNGTPAASFPLPGNGGNGDSGNNTGGTNGGLYGGGGGGGTTTGHNGAAGIVVVTTYF